MSGSITADVAPVVENSKENPANAEPRTQAERKRIPMSVPVQRLELPEIPGHHIHWFRGDAGRISRAMNAGYEFIRPEEVMLNNVSLGGNTAVSGNTDMGSQVSVSAGDDLGADGQPARLIAMKIKQEYYEESMAILDARNEQVASALRGDPYGAETDPNPGDPSQRYVDKSKLKVPELFRRKT